MASISMPDSLDAVNTSSAGSVFWAAPETIADVALVFKDGSRIYALKALLIIWSPNVLGTVLQDCKTKTQNGITLINMAADDDYGLWKSLMPLMFPHIPRKEQAPLVLQPDNAWPVLQLADKYGMAPLCSRVEEFLLKQKFLTAINSPSYTYTEQMPDVTSSVLNEKNLNAVFWLEKADKMSMPRVAVRCAAAAGRIAYTGACTGSTAAKENLARAVDSWFAKYYPEEQSLLGAMYQVFRNGV